MSDDLRPEQVEALVAALQPRAATRRAAEGMVAALIPTVTRAVAEAWADGYNTAITQPAHPSPGYTTKRENT